LIEMILLGLGFVEPVKASGKPLHPTCGVHGNQPIPTGHGHHGKGPSRAAQDGPPPPGLPMEVDCSPQIGFGPRWARCSYEPTSMGCRIRASAIPHEAATYLLRPPSRSCRTENEFRRTSLSGRRRQIAPSRSSCGDRFPA
jgi:hypothetical protein